MATVKVKCPYCGSEKVIGCGKSKSGKQRYACKNSECSHKIFQLEDQYNGCKQECHERGHDYGYGVRARISCMGTEIP